MSTVRDLTRMTSFLQKYFAVRSGLMQPSQHCCTHKRFCNFPHVSFVSPGLPCQPNSRQSPNARREHDERFACYIVFAFFHILAMTVSVLIENVVEPWSELTDVFHVKYLELDFHLPSSGWGRARRSFFSWFA